MQTSDFAQHYDPKAPLLLNNANIYSTDDPFAEAMLIENQQVTWVGSAASATSLFGNRICVLQLEGNLVTPSFWELASTAVCPSREAWGISQNYTADQIPSKCELVELAPGLEFDFRTLAASGTPYILSGTRNELSPWEVIRAAAYLAKPEFRISARSAFLAMTRSPRRMLTNSPTDAINSGVINPGALNAGVTASFVIWEPWPLIVRGNDEVIQTWSTDPRSRTPLLPDLEPKTVDNQVPKAEYLFEAGELVFTAR